MGWFRGLITRIQNAEHRVSGIRPVYPTQLLKSDTRCIYLQCPRCSQTVAIIRFLPTSQHQEQETTKKEHEPNQGCEDCQETTE